MREKTKAEKTQKPWPTVRVYPIRFWPALQLKTPLVTCILLGDAAENRLNSVSSYGSPRYNASGDHKGHVLELCGTKILETSILGFFGREMANAG